MFYKYFIVTPDYKVQEQTADDMEVVKDHAQIVCGTNDKLEYEDYTVYFNNTKVESANFAVGNIGAYGTLVFCIGKDSDDVNSPDDIANTKLVVMFGNNPTETRMSGGGVTYYVEQARERSNAVSYTHLDVYKRQVHWRSPSIQYVPLEKPALRPLSR